MAYQTLVPVSQLKCDSEDHSHWVSEGQDPQFLVSSEEEMRAGWYLINYEMVAAGNAPMTPLLYPDFGAGYSEGSAILLPSSGHGAKARNFVVMFPRRVHALRFDPDDGSGEFSIRGFNIRPVWRGAAAWTMLSSLWRQSRYGERRLDLVKDMKDAWKRDGLKGVGDYLYDSYSLKRQNALDLQSYAKWIEKFECRDPGAPAGHEEVGFKPLISILMPTYNSDLRWLKRCIDSVLRQHYEHWELCIADDASTDPRVHKFLRRIMRLEPRVKVVFRPSNGHISEASNSALGIATGDYVALLDHDDELHPRALQEVVKALNRNPDWKAIYSDEDKIDSTGRRQDPYFKPEWDRDLILGQNFFSHMGVYKTSLVRQVCGFRKGFEGSQDHDLILRCAEHLSDAEIGHIPKVLYHWRIIEGSTAKGVGEKSYATIAGEKAVQEHLNRTGVHGAGVSVLPNGFFRVSRPTPAPAPLVTLVIPTRDRADLLELCVTSILERTSYRPFEILIVDNGSVEERTFALFRSLMADSRVQVLAYDKPFNYSAINNFAVAQARGEIVGLLNNDVEVITPEWLDEMVSHAVRPEVGAVGCMLLYPDDTIQHAGVIVGLHGVAGHAYSRMPRECNGYMGRAMLTQTLSAVTAACLLISKAKYQEVGGLDTQLKVAFNDVDFCLRIREAGYRNIWTPNACLYHHESASRGVEDTPEKVARFHSEVDFMMQRWGDSLSSDPSYNPNLTLTGEPFGLAYPPRC